jgi:hypothetical protein
MVMWSAEPPRLVGLPRGGFDAELIRRYCADYNWKNQLVGSGFGGQFAMEYSIVTALNITTSEFRYRKMVWYNRVYSGYLVVPPSDANVATGQVRGTWGGVTNETRWISTLAAFGASLQTFREVAGAGTYDFAISVAPQEAAVTTLSKQGAVYYFQTSQQINSSDDNKFNSVFRY